MSIILCCYELGGVWVGGVCGVCVWGGGVCVWGGVCMSACLFRCLVGEGGTWVGFVVFLVLSGWGWDLFGKSPVI